MAYLDLLEDEIATSQYLAVLRPRRRITDFTLFSGSVYVADFDFGEVTAAWEGLDALDLGTSSALSAGQFYYDSDASQLYVRLSGGGNPNSIWLVAAYEIYCATIDAHWYRVPTDDSTRPVYFEPIIKKSPMFKATASDSEFGFNPIQSSTMDLINAEHIFERHISESSFNRADCEIYHWLGDLETANIKLVLQGVITKVSLNPPVVQLKISDRVDILLGEWRHPAGQDSFLTLDTFPELDPDADGRPLRAVYGLITDGFVPVNIDYLSESPSTSDNRTWLVCTGDGGLNDVVHTVPASPSSTTTRTYLNSVDGLNIDDAVWIDKSSDEYVFVTAVGANYIEHSTLSVAATTGDTVNRAFVGRITIVQNGVSYFPLYNRDYTISHIIGGGSSGFVFSTSLESNLSIPATLSPNDRVFCRVYGRANDLTLGGPAFGSDDARTANLAHPAQFVLDVLKNHLAVPESQIDSASFTQALTDQASGIGIAIPETYSTTTFPKYKDVIGDVLQSALAKLIVDANGKWSLITTQPLGSVDKSVADDEILEGSISWDYLYDDLVSDVKVLYAKKETSGGDVGISRSLTVTSQTESGTYLHRASKTQSQDSVWAYETEAQQLADHLAFILGERRGQATIDVKNRFYTSKLGDNIEVNRVYIPGFDVDGETVFSQEHAILEIDKSRNRVTLTLDDRKGIEDNQGDW